MKAVSVIIALCSFVCSAQTVTRFSQASTTFDVLVDSRQCDENEKCGPIEVTLSRKHSSKPFQTIVAGRLGKSWLGESVQFIDINFDGIKDLFIFDGLTAPGGNGTHSYRIYLYSPHGRLFEFNEELSELSQNESLLLEPQDLKKMQIVTYARPGGGVFQNRWYRVVNNRPRMFKEIISDATYMDGKWTLDTTRVLVKGRWIVRRKRTKTIFNQ